jgi:transcriptional regulator with XRE-family HTH domain
MLSKVADRIKECREERGMNADQLAKIIGKDRSTIFRYEKDEIGNIPVVVVQAIAVALDVNPAYLMGWSDEKTPSRNEKPVTQLDDEHAGLIERYDALDQKKKDQLMAFLQFLES